MPTAKKHKRTTKKKKPVKRRSVKVKRRVTPRKTVKKRVKRKPKTVRSIQRTSVVRVITGKKVKRRRRHSKRRVVMAGRHRRRSVSGKGGSNALLIGILGLGALYLLTRSRATTTYPNYPQLPPLTQTSNYQRNDQSSAILNYALAAGLAASAISSLIDKLNRSNDQDVKNIYDQVETTGSLPDYVYV